MAKRHYITTAIDYPNAAPHMGHAMEKILADVCARWRRLSGDEVRFQTGTDEHGIKIQQTAQKEAVTPQQLVDRNTPLFEDLYRRLNISYDVFVRTTDKSVHWPTVQALWKKLQDAGMLEKRTYTGLYCSGCERFLTAKDLEDGKCPIHKREPEKVQEENWFFLLSTQQVYLKTLLTTDYTIIPAFRAPETMTLLEQGLEDVSFSRPTSSLQWGIPVPGDEQQTMYVWCDALTNYISTLGLLTKDADATWWDDATVTHVIGKDIARFHALIWPAMLKASGVRAPDQLLIHGFLTSEGQKMSKSLGNVVVPDDVIGAYGVDALRFYLSHEVTVGNDGDFTWEHFDSVYNSMLRNQLGNLLNRVLILLKKTNDGRLAEEFPMSSDRIDERVWKNYGELMDHFRFSNALQAVQQLVVGCNEYIEANKVYKMEGEEKLKALTFLAEQMRHIALMLLPFIPETAQRIAKQLNVPYAEEMAEKSFVITDALKLWGGLKDWHQVGEPKILFSPVEKEEK